MKCFKIFCVLTHGSRYQSDLILRMYFDEIQRKCMVLIVYYDVDEVDVAQVDAIELK